MWRDARAADVTSQPFRGVDKIRVWAAANLFAEVTVKELADKVGLPATVVRKFVADNPDLFRKGEGWRYEVRDAIADREGAGAVKRRAA
jgi:hypothetical protein